jgi:hypothetical protein
MYLEKKQEAINAYAVQILLKTIKYIQSDASFD